MIALLVLGCVLLGLPAVLAQSRRPVQFQHDRAVRKYLTDVRVSLQQTTASDTALRAVVDAAGLVQPWRAICESEEASKMADALALANGQSGRAQYRHEALTHDGATSAAYGLRVHLDLLVADEEDADPKDPAVPRMIIVNGTITYVAEHWLPLAQLRPLPANYAYICAHFCGWSGGPRLAVYAAPWGFCPEQCFETWDRVDPNGQELEIIYARVKQQLDGTTTTPLLPSGGQPCGDQGGRPATAPYWAVEPRLPAGFG